MIANEELSHKSSKAWRVIQLNANIFSDTVKCHVLHLHPAQSPAAAPERQRSAVAL